MINNLRFLYSGKDGQLGLCFSELAPYAKEHGVEIQGLSRADLDITNLEQIIKALDTYKPDVFFNFAAYTQVDLAETEPEKAKLINSDGPTLLAIECKKRKIPLIHISTDYVFDGAKPEPYTINDQPNPINIYGKTKLSGERGIIDNIDEYLIIRTSWVFSRHGQNFLKTMVRLGKEKEELSIIDDQRGGPTYAPDLARFIFDLALASLENKKGWGLYHYSGLPYVSWYEFAQKIFEYILPPTPSLKRVSSLQYSSKANRPNNSCLMSNHSFGSSHWEKGIQDVLKK